MTKKKGEYSVLSEVNTEDDWIKLCKREVNTENTDYPLSSENEYSAQSGKHCQTAGLRVRD
jgi:hypothetical protein